KQNGAAEFKGFNFTEKGVAADGTYNLKIDVQERRVLAFYVDGVLFNAQFMDSLGNASTNLGLDSSTTKLSIYLIWTDDDTVFGLYPNE
ncbi:MAG: hypothetical protein MJ072_03070, partial [Clostridia bacterium]|nr:hypothetical protein [Clostridia bacterium]